MTLICLASQKGSPGTSAATLAIAAAHRPGQGRRKLLLEADLSGGALAIRYRLPTEPGLVTLAAAARAGLTDDELWRHTVELPGGLPAIVCPDGPDQVHSAMAAAGAILGRHLAERRDLDVICDLGRLPPGSPAVELAAEATAVLMVARPTAEQLQPAARRMLALRPRMANLGWLLVGEKPYGPAEVESTFGFPVVGVLANDRRSVEAIEGGAVTRRVRRHPFVRSAATVASTLATWMAPLAAVEPELEPEREPVAPSDEVGAEAREVGGAGAEVRPDRLAGTADVEDPPFVHLDPPPLPPEAEPEVMGEPAPVSRSAPPAPLAPMARMSDRADGSGPPVTVDRDRPPAGVESTPSPADDQALAMIDPPVVPSPPLPPAPTGSAKPTAPDPFVHDEDDVEWTGT